MYTEALDYPELEGHTKIIYLNWNPFQKWQETEMTFKLQAKMMELLWKVVVENCC